MKNILFAIADSIPSEDKWKQINRIAQFSKVSLTIIHVMEDTTALLNAVDGALERNHGIKFPKQEWKHYKNEEKRLQDFIDKKSNQLYPSTNIIGLVKVGKVVDTILSEEQTGKYDLLVLGNTPINSMCARILGSVSKTVMNKSLTPVFLVPSSSSFRGINKMIYSTDLEYDDIDQIESLIRRQKNSERIDSKSMNF